MSSNKSRPRFRVKAVGLLSVAVLTLSSCASDGGDGGDTQAEPEADAPFDLTGEDLSIGTAQEQTLDIGTSYAIELLNEWGADARREELTNISGLEAIVADRVDVAARSADEVIEGNAKGVSVVAFGAPASVMHYAFVVQPGIEAISDLEGSTVGISGPGGFDTMLLEALLREEGLDSSSDVNTVPIGGSGERTSALLAGQVEAAIIFMDNWLSMERQDADVELLGYIADIIPGLVSRAFSAERAFIDQNEELVTAIACANLEANAWINSDRADYIEFTTSRVTGVSEEDVGAFYDEAVELNMFPVDPDDILPPENFRNTADLMLDAGIIDEDVDVSEFVDTSYLEAAQEAGCGEG